MKFFLTMILMTSFVYAAGTVTKGPANPKKSAVTEKPHKLPKELNSLDKKLEDCDEKAKKPVEITPESISLSGNTGCSLDEAE